MDDLLKQITAFADQAHGEQQRKYTPERYIVHPVRVMEALKTFTNDTAVLAAALLHDVLEDTPVTADEIKTFLLPLMGEKQTKRTLQLVTELTDVYIKDAYPHLNRRARKNKEIERLAATSTAAQTIKYADIIDNTNEIVKNDPDFARIFLFECRAILKKINKGDEALYKKAIETVNQCINELNN